MGRNYTGDDISVLEGLEAVRVRPGMYIGDTGIKGLHHILWEIIDNAMDEAANGYGNEIEIELFADGSVSVRDHGRGVPFSLNKEKNLPGVVLIYTVLHAGGKFGNSNYDFSGGLHGVGASVTNALSSWLTVEAFDSGVKRKIRFIAKKQKDILVGGHVDGEIEEELCSKREKGTSVHFMPDPTVFEKGVKFDFHTIEKRMQTLAYLNKGITITLTDHREIDSDTKKNKTVKFHHANGIIEYVEHLTANKNKILKEVVYLNGDNSKDVLEGKEKDKLKLEVAFTYAKNDYDDVIASYVNNIPTTTGGSHEQGFKTALANAIEEVGRAKGFIKEKDQLQSEDFRANLFTILNVYMQNPIFSGQTKEHLETPMAKAAVYNIVYEKLSNYLLALKKDQLEPIFKAVRDAMEDRLKRASNKDIQKKKREVSKLNIAGKLAVCTGKDASRNELYLVEGDSAGGSAKQGRNREFQAILPLRGKVLNVEKEQSVIKLLNNEEIVTMIKTLGAEFGKDFDLSKLKYDKVIILADADQDGAHIRSLLITLFYKYMRPLIEDGHLYIGLPPLYKIETKGKVLYVYDDAAKDELMATLPRGYKVQRYKGLGEMNPSQLWETTMDPARRTLIQVRIEDIAETQDIIETLMGNETNDRKEFITKNANFNKVDSFEKESNQ